MRISPKPLSPSDALADASAQVADDAPKTSPAAIDARRAQQLLERTTALAGRGDMGAAVLATRQALALAPTNVEGHVLLARLLERNRDFGGARAAYEKSAQLAPDRADVRDNLARLNAYLKQSQGAARQFHFDSDELFAPAAEGEEFDNETKKGEISETQAPVAIAPVESKSAEFEAPATFDGSMFDESMLPSIEARLPPSRGASQPEVRVETPTPAAVQTAKPMEDRRKHNVPVAVERRCAPIAPAPIVSAPVASAPIKSAPVASAPLASAPIASAPITSTPLSVVPIAPAPVAVAPIVSVPLTARASDDISALDAATNAGAAPHARPIPLPLDLTDAPPISLWQQVAARPSFYARTLPVVAVALLSLGFLSWARGLAVSRVVAPAPNELAQATLPISPDASNAPNAPAQNITAPDGPTAPDVAANPNAASPNSDAGGFPISNAPATVQAPGAPNAANGAPGAATPGNAAASNAAASNDASSTTARASNRAANGGDASRLPRRVLPPARPVPRFPSVTLAPAPIPPASIRSTIPNVGEPQNGGGNNIVLPRPSVDFPSAPAPRQRVLPPSDSGLNPAGSPGRGYVRITEGRVGNGVIPSQPGNVARQSENNAGEAARNGQTDQAISQLSQSLRDDNESAGFRFQQRATLFLQRGDYTRASDDFQSAISAYQSQISSGQDVAQAKRGLSSARSGLTLALAGKRG